MCDEGAVVAAWRRAAVPWWVPRIVLPVLWAAAVVASVVCDVQPCSPADPAICGPDASFGWAAIALLASPVLLWWSPLAGCATGITIAVLDLAYDDVPGARVAWSVYGAVCLVTGGWMLWSRHRQRAILSSLGREYVTVPWVAAPVGGGVVTLVGAVLAAGLSYHAVHALASENAHRAAAVTVDGRVSSVDAENITIVVRVPSGGDHRFEVYDTETYPVGSTTPVRVEPGSDWAELVAEASDRTMWITAAGLAWVATTAAGWRYLRRRSVLRRSASGPREAVHVRVRPDGYGGIVYAGDDVHGTRALATIGGDWARRPDVRLEFGHAGTGAAEVDPEAFRRSWRADAVPPEGPRDVVPVRAPRFSGATTPALLVGGRAAGDWALLLTGEWLLRPSAPIRVARSGERRGVPDPALPGTALPATGPHGDDVFDRDRLDEDDADDEPPGRRASAHDLRGEPALPLTLHAPLRTRLLGALRAVAGLLSPPLVVVAGFTDDLVLLLGCLVAGVTAVVTGVYGMTLGVRFDAEAITFRGLLRNRRVPWERVHGARIDEDHVVVIAHEPADLVFLGPFGRGPWPAGAPDDATVATQVAALAEHLRERALSGGVHGGGPATSPGPGALGVVLFAAVAAATLWWHTQG
jgi:hypothetical protein